MIFLSAFQRSRGIEGFGSLVADKYVRRCSCGSLLEFCGPEHAKCSGMKLCTTGCRKVKPRAEFYLTSHGTPQPLCKPCSHARNAARMRRLYQTKPEFREREKARWRAEYTANKDVYKIKAKQRRDAARKARLEGQK